MKGTISIVDVHSPALEGNPLGDPATRPLVVYLPPGYQAGTAAYPVGYFLHGYTGSALGWLNVQAYSPNVPQRISDLVSSGAIPPFIAVFLDGFTRVGGTQWINSEAVGRYRDYVVEDIVGYVDSHYRTLARRESRLIIGKSSGGYGAVALARQDSAVFAHCCCHSGDAAFEYCYLGDFPKAADAILQAGGVLPAFEALVKRATETKMRGDDHALINTIGMAAAYSPKAGAPLGLELPFDPATCRLLPEVWNRWLAHDPVRFIGHSADAFRSLSSFFIDCGTRDEANLRWGARMIVEELARIGVTAVHEEFPDGHMGIQYRYDRSLRHLIPRLARSA